MATRVPGGAVGAAEAEYVLLGGVWPLKGLMYHSTPRTRTIPAVTTAFFTAQFSCSDKDRQSVAPYRLSRGACRFGHSLYPASCRIR